MAQDVIITPASGEINFKDSGTSVALIDIDGSNNLSITNSGGNLSIGDTASDVYIGDGTNNVDLILDSMDSKKVIEEFSPKFNMRLDRSKHQSKTFHDQPLSYISKSILKMTNEI